ncbi:MAG: sigma-70 family RNA polymerase sigma factor [Planctomycetes bacterium]|nr:sigma-70 family RNA polymerase sigma factor [Planctomycetota bacterium]
MDHAGAQDLTTLHVRQAVAGDVESLSWIVGRFTPLLVAQARYRLRGDLGQLYEPDDIVHEVWLRVLPRLGELTPEQRFTPTLVSYLSRAVLHQVNNVMRRMLRRRRHGGLAPGAAADAARDAPDARSGLISGLLRNERRAAVLAAIEALPELDREVLILRAIEQHPNPVAAAMLGVEPGTLAVRYHRALQRLREQLPNSVFDEFEPEA